MEKLETISRETGREKSALDNGGIWLGPTSFVEFFLIMDFLGYLGQRSDEPEASKSAANTPYRVPLYESTSSRNPLMVRPLRPPGIQTRPRPVGMTASTN